MNLPDALFNKLADLGELYDMRVDELMLELSAQALARRAPDLSHPVVSRWRQGMTDKQIAADLDWTNAAVSDARRRRGLPANSRRNGVARVKAETGLGGAVGRSERVSGSNSSPRVTGVSAVSDANTSTDRKAA